MPPIPGKAFTKQLPFLNNDDGIFEPEFIEERRLGLEEFLNKVAGHPLVQGERCLHIFLTEQFLDKASYALLSDYSDAWMLPVVCRAYDAKRMRILWPMLKGVPDYRKIITSSSSDTNGHRTEVRRWLLVLNQGLG